MKLKAEIISIGDELTSGQRVDTNSQWLSCKLGDLGIEVAFHTTVGDDLQDNVLAFRTAAQRASFIVTTGGLGPTADDLTRFAIAEFAQVELIEKPEIVDHIREMFNRFGREMPDSNIVQAQFPEGSNVIVNPEGTAPGIDFVVGEASEHECRIFALPGVPAEMKQMWMDSVEPAIQKATGLDRVIHHHVLHCFGVGESHAEMMLPELTRRGREPRVGITASKATISLRITAHDDSIEKCVAQMEPTIQEIRELMGDLVFGQDGQELQDVVSHQMLQLEKTIAIVDLGLHGDVAKHLIDADPKRSDNYFRGSLVLNESSATRWLSASSGFDLASAASKVREEFKAEIGVAIGTIQPPTKTEPRARFNVAVAMNDELISAEFTHAGHSDIRHIRSVKQVLNHLRLLLATSETES